MPRVEGNVAPLLTFKVGSSAAVDVSQWVVSMGFDEGEGNPLTMTDYSAGTSPVQLNVTFALDFAATAPFEFLWTNSGVVAVTYVVQFAAGTVSQTNPKFTGTCTLPSKPLPSVEAGTDEQTFDVEVACDTYTKAIA